MAEFSTSGAAPARHVRPLRTIHNVAPGDTLGSIAKTYGLSEGELIKNNSHAVGAQGIIHPGMRLEIG